MTRIDEILPRIYRISAFSPQAGITFNQFLIDDAAPTLIHTGYYQDYGEVRAAVARVLDPKRLAYMVVPHFEADECGGMGQFLAEAPTATLVCGELGAMLNLSGWDYKGRVTGLRDGGVVELGDKRLRLIETPHVHHWDSMMVLEETTNSLFPADLFIQPGDQPPVVREDLGTEMCNLYRAVGIFGGREPVLATVSRIEEFAPAWVHPMHGGSLPGELLPTYISALRTQPFAFEGRVFGRAVVDATPS
jgi:flavorubredoxin